MKKILVSAFALWLTVGTVTAQKFSAEETYSKSLDAVASPERRSKLRNVTAVGDAGFTQGSNYQRAILGKSVFVSDQNRIALAMAFQLDDYRTDRLTFDGKKLAIPYIRPGVRSVFGEFLTRNEEIVKEGLLGGTLSTGWLLSDRQARLKRLSESGTRKIGDRETLVLTFSPKSGTGLSVRFFFDAKNFYHLRTEYRRTISAQMGPTPETSARQNESVEEMSEEFSDHITENGITLPRTYKVRVAQIRGGNNREFFYEFKFNTFYYDQDLEPETFDTNFK